METTRQRCATCLFWTSIEHEGSSGCPTRPAQGERADWGTCNAAPYNPQEMRVKGQLETKNVHWCTLYKKGVAD